MKTGLRMKWVLPIFIASSLGAQSPGYFVHPKFSAPREIERVIELVPADHDQWVGEQDYEEIQAELKDTAANLKKGDAVVPPLAEAISRFEHLELIELKVVGSGRASREENVATVAVRVELGGTRTGGGLLSLLGSMSMEWVRAAGKWKLRGAQTGPMREVQAAARYFTDISEQALGANPSYRDQLSKGIDHWRSVLDAAVGVDIYGHQGVSIVDYDNDGWEDFYVAQPSGLPNRLFRNNGDGTFTDTTRQAGLDILDDTSMALFADFDRDGDTDLIALHGQGPRLFRNNGKGKFEHDPKSDFGNLTAGNATLISMAAADYDNDGDLDLYLCAYEFWSGGAAYHTPTPYYDAANGPPNRLLRNRGDGTFEDVTEASGMMVNNNRFSLAAGWADYDGDGDMDLYVANDFGRNNLYRNNGDGTFSDVAAAAGVEDMAAGMSVGWGDYDGDGQLDLYVSNMWSSAGQRVTHNPQFRQVAADASLRQSFQRHARGNSLFRNNGDGAFSDVTLDAGVEMGRWAWGSDFVDLDNDGELDIFVQNGFITGPDLDDL